MADVTEVPLDTAAAPSDPTPAAADAAAAPSAAAGKTDTPQVPESYPFTFSESTLLDTAAVTSRLTDRLKAMQVVDTKVAQSYAEVVDAEVTEFSKAYVAAHQPDGTAFKAMVDGFTAEALSAPDLGNGDPLRLEQVQVNAKLVLQKYAPNALTAFAKTGTLYHPEMLRLLNGVHRATQEPGSPPPNTATFSTARSWDQKMYPSGIPLDTGSVSAGP